MEAFGQVICKMAMALQWLELRGPVIKIRRMEFQDKYLLIGLIQTL